MIISPNSFRVLCAIGAGALTFAVAACSDPGGVAPTSIPPNASTGPGNAFGPGEGTGADTGFPSNGGGNGPNAPGH
jgi:hypothetical protein